MIDSEYLRFERTTRPERKTPVVVVISKSGDYALGEIKWYGAWRQFCFYPRPATTFNVGCLDDIKAQIGELMAERR